MSDKGTYLNTIAQMRPVITGMILAILQAFIAATPQQAASATIRGIVVVEGTDNPIAGAELTLTTFKPFNPRYPRQSSAQAVPPVTTDRDGKFVLKSVVAGSYRLTIMRNGFAKQIYGQHVPNGPVPALEVSEGETVENLIIRLRPAGSISGVVRNTSGRSIAGVDVQLLQRVYSETDDRSFSTIASTNTNDRGEYRFYWASPGLYYVRAGNDSQCRLAPDACEQLSKIQTFDRGIETGANPDQADSYRAVYYPGVRDTEKAASIDLQPGAELGAIDFTLERLRYHIRGRVIDSTTGQPPSWAGIDIYEVGGASGIGWYDYTPGELEISNLGPGTYWVRVSVDEPKSGQAPLAAAPAKFVIVDSDIDGVVFTLTPSSIITGRIHVDGDQQAGKSLDDLDVRLVSKTEPSSNRTWFQTKDGDVTLRGIPDGEFRITMPTLPPGFFLKEARLNGVDLLTAPAALQPGTLELVVSSKGGQIDGVVWDDHSHPMPYVQAVLVPNSSDRPELFKNVITDKNGRFRMNAIAPSDYTLFAWEAIELYSWFDPEVLKLYQARGQAVHVTESSRQTLDARMIPAGDAR